MSTVNSKFYYYSGASWIEATSIMACELQARLNAPSVLSVTLSNVSSLEATFPAYRKVKLTERATGRDIFIGRVESSSPTYDSNYGPILKLTCYDYIQVLKNKFLNSSFTGYTRRSDIVNAMVTGTIYAGDLTVTNISLSESSGAALAYTYTASEILPFQAITDIAKEDPWTSGTGVGYDFRVDLGTQDFRYFKRGTLPVGGTSASGLTLVFQEATDTKTKAYMQDYSFTDSPKETITRVIVRGVDVSGTSISASAVNATAEAALGLYKEKIVTVYGTSTTATLATRASGTLHQTLGPSISRGSVNIFGFPTYIIGGSAQILQPGDLVHVHNTRQAINEDYLVSSLVYSEPDTVTKINLIKGIVGWGTSPEEFTSFVEQTQNNAVLNMSKLGDVIIDNAKIGTCSINKLTVGTLDFDGTLGAGAWNTNSASGTNRVVFDNSGISGKTAYTLLFGWYGNLVSDAYALREYVYLQQFYSRRSGTLDKVKIECSATGHVKLCLYSDSGGSPDTLLGSTSSLAVTAGWNILAFTGYSQTSGTPYWLGFNSDTDNLVCTKITSGYTVVRKSTSYASSFANPISGTFPVTTASPMIGAYEDTEETQFYLDSSDGSILACGGRLLIDGNGLTIFDSLDNYSYVKFMAPNGQRSANFLWINNDEFNIVTDFDLDINCYGAMVIAANETLSLYGASGIVLESDVTPVTTAKSLGTSGSPFYNVYAANHVMKGTAQALEGNIGYETGLGYYFGVYSNGAWREVELPI